MANKIAAINLHESTVISKLQHVQNERNIAISDLLEKNSFKLVDGFSGPYNLDLSLKDARLIMDVTSDENKKKISLPLKPLNKIIKDYFMICESYFEAVKQANSRSVEALDMGRRGIHNDGAKKLSTNLAPKIEMDFDTARRLFTLICVLHFR